MEFAIQIVPLAVNEQDFNIGLQSLFLKMLKIHYHLKCRYFIDNNFDINL